MIRVDDLHMHFGGHSRGRRGRASRSRKGSITGLIGPNGAGKTHHVSTSSPATTGPTSGRRVAGRRGHHPGLTPHELFAKGLLRTFQIAHEFSTLSVRDNSDDWCPGGQPGESLMDVWLRPSRVRAHEVDVRKRADEG